MADKPIKHLVSSDYLGNAIMNAVLHPVANDPASPDNYQVWANSTENRIKIRLPGAIKSLSFTDDAPGGSLSGDLFDANTILAANTDNTPLALPVAPSTVIGRAATGNIVALTAADLRTVLGIPTGNIATEAYATAAVAAVIDTAPGALDTLNELAAALGDDPNFAATVNAAIAARTKRFVADVGDAVTTTFSLAHGFGDADVVVSVRDKSSGERVYVGETHTAANVQLDFQTAPTNAQYRVVVVGI